MKKRARPQAGSGVQMFPFLDALICTMGALLVLLHAFARHGQVEATKKAETQVVETDDASESLEEVRWRAAQLKEARDKTQAQLADERQKLSHIEDHERRLREQFDKLRIAAAELERAQSSGSAEDREASKALAAMRARLERARQEVDEARRMAQERAVSYSVVPYEGPNSTHRRPIYIECRADAIVLQPEGIELVSDDFVGFLGPGNPLASALRGMTEYLARQSNDPKLGGQPYPLLLVRPDGVQAYMAARAALHSWGTDFGYELIGSDWKLSFPKPDVRMAEVMREAVADARVRQREYILTSPMLTKNRSRRTYHASAHGGFTAERGSGDGGSGDGDAPGGWGRRPGRGGTFGTRGSQGGNGAGGNSALTGGSGGGGAGGPGSLGDDPGGAGLGGQGVGGQGIGGAGLAGQGPGGPDPSGLGTGGAGVAGQGAGGQGPGGLGLGGTGVAGQGAGGQGPGGSGDSRYGQFAGGSGGGYGNGTGRYGEVAGGTGGPGGTGGDPNGTGADSRYGQQNSGGTGEYAQGGGRPGGPYDPNGSSGGGAAADNARGGQYAANGQNGANGQYAANGQYTAGGQSGGQYAAGSQAAAGQNTGGGQSGTSAQPQAGTRGSAGGQPGGQPGGQTQGSSSDQASSSGGSGSSDPSGSSAGSSMSSNVTLGGGPSNPNSPQGRRGHSMAKTRGRDWGLPESGNRQSAATRPILIECYNDRLVILGESASELPKEIRLHEKTQESMDEFVSDVWTHMKGWGPAGKGLYWKPTLWMDVRPGAADRFAEIKTLLDGSGLEVHERQPRAARKTAPAKKTRR